jgi:hypothetical protein
MPSAQRYASNERFQPHSQHYCTRRAPPCGPRLWAVLGLDHDRERRTLGGASRNTRPASIRRVSASRHAPGNSIGTYRSKLCTGRRGWVLNLCARRGASTVALQWLRSRRSRPPRKHPASSCASADAGEANEAPGNESFRTLPILHSSAALRRGSAIQLLEQPRKVACFSLEAACQHAADDDDDGPVLSCPERRAGRPVTPPPRNAHFTRRASPCFPRRDDGGDAV